MNDVVAYIAGMAQKIRDAGIPNDLNRWLAMTPTALTETEAAVARQVRANQRSIEMPKTIGPKEAQVRAMRESNTTPGAKRQAQPRAALAALIQPKAKPEANPKETTMKTKKAKSKAKPAGKKRAAAKRPAKAAAGEAKAPRDGSKLEIVNGLLTQPGGCTSAEVLKATGWPSVSMPQMAKSAGLKLRKEKEKGQPTQYFGEPLE